MLNCLNGGYSVARKELKTASACRGSNKIFTLTPIVLDENICIQERFTAHSIYLARNVFLPCRTRDASSDPSSLHRRAPC